MKQRVTAEDEVICEETLRMKKANQYVNSVRPGEINCFIRI